MKLDTMKKTAIASLSMMIVNLIAAVLYILTLPDLVPTQFDEKLNCTALGSRWNGLLLPVLLLIVLAVAFLFYSRSKNRDKNMHVIKLAAFLISAVGAAVSWFILFLMRNDVQPGEMLDKQFWWMLPFLFGAVCILIGNYLPTVRKNLMLGYRVPWTLKNEQCWKLTHQFAGKITVISGLLTIAAALILKAVGTEQMELYIIVTIILLTLVVFVPLIYSFAHRNA